MPWLQTADSTSQQDARDAKDSRKQPVRGLRLARLQLCFQHSSLNLRFWNQSPRNLSVQGDLRNVRPRSSSCRYRLLRRRVPFGGRSAGSWRLPRRSTTPSAVKSRMHAPTVRDLAPNLAALRSIVPGGRHVAALPDPKGVGALQRRASHLC